MARTQGHGNPKWTRDETILALNLYFECNGNIPDRNDERIQELSKFLRRLPYQHTADKKGSFRNADGVAFKLQNLRQVATGKGLGNVSQMDRIVWGEFGAYPARVKTLAALIRNGVASSEVHERDSDSDGEEFSEGKVLTEMHKRRERDHRVRRRLLASRRKLGALKCDMCLAGARCRDPKLEDAWFEAHHLLPISSAAERKTRLSDIALVCANCHRLLHRAISVSKGWLGIADGKKLLGMASGSS